MNVRRLVIAGVAALAIAAVAAPAAHARDFEGQIVARNAKAKTFTIRQDEGGGTFKIKVNAATRFERLPGFSAIKVGRTDIEVTARPAKGRWIATEVERR